MGRTTKDSFLRPFGSTSYDTPSTRHHLSAKSGWLTFYTAVKLSVVIALALVAFANILDWVFRDEGRRWLDGLIQTGLVGFGITAFYVLEKNVFFGFRAYLDVVKQNEALEEKLREASSEPIYLPIFETEKSVPARKDRFLTLLFVLSKYLVFLIYAVLTAFFSITLFMDGPFHDGRILLAAFLIGPPIVLCLGYWIYRSEKDIRIAFAGGSTLKVELEALRQKNAELSAVAP